MLHARTTSGFPLAFARPAPTKLEMMGIRFENEPGNGEGAGGGEGGQQQNNQQQQSTEQESRGYPANTPVKDMKPEEQAAYHAFHARKHENRVKEYGEITPQQAKDALAEIQRLKTANQSQAEKDLEAAKAEGAAPFKTLLGQERVNSALTVLLTGRVLNATALATFDRDAFVKDDATADSDAIKAWVEANSTAAQATRRAVNLGQGDREQVVAGPGEAGKAEAARRFKKQQ
jgi:hypothetical protein